MQPDLPWEVRQQQLLFEYNIKKKLKRVKLLKTSVSDENISMSTCQVFQLEPTIIVIQIQLIFYFIQVTLIL